MTDDGSRENPMDPMDLAITADRLGIDLSLLGDPGTHAETIARTSLITANLDALLKRLEAGELNRDQVSYRVVAWRLRLIRDRLNSMDLTESA